MQRVFPPSRFRSVHSNHSVEEWDGVAATLWSCIQEFLVSNLVRDTGSHGFSQPLKENAGTLSRLGRGRFIDSSPNH
jgi:hypothetical protein